MKQSAANLASALLTACLVSTACGSPGQPRSTGPASLEGVLGVVRVRYGLPALAAVVVRADGSMEVRAVGVRRTGSLTPVSPDDRWHLGSNTKAFTATLIARLVERRRLTWDTTVGQVLGPVMRVHPACQAITVEQLLSHSAGLSHDFPIDPAWRRAVARQGLTHQQRLDLVAPHLAQPPLYAPGSRHSYSNVGFVVAGSMAEVVEGRSWEEQVVEGVLGPLAIGSGGFGAPGGPGTADQPWGHRRGIFGLVAVPPGPGADNPPALGPEGTLHMSMADYGRILVDNLAGERGSRRLLAGETYRHLHSDDGRPGWGLGWGVRHGPTWGRVLTHTGSNGHWYHLVWASLGRGVGVAIATNAADGERPDPLPASCGCAWGFCLRFPH